MPNLRDGERYVTYKCGRCKGNIMYLPGNKPEACPECGYGHGSRDVNDIPAEIRLNLDCKNNSEDGSRGITEQTTITSR